MTQPASAVAISYRRLGSLIRKLPKAQQPKAFTQLQEGFRKNEKAEKSLIPALLDRAEQKAAFLRIMTPKGIRKEPQAGSVRYIYGPSGEVEEGGKGTQLGKAPVSNWDGKNLDPCSVKRHNYSLNRMGFVNNLHAKGIF
mmetsp:Transcript_9120/g.13219  ORF Transcript_9120/g.13219 Transcript_9120/m.13219 type:complete len:140 (+) Transcript_9120:107-526(+)